MLEGRTLIFKNLSSKKIEYLGSKGLRALLKYDQEGKQTQHIDGFDITKNKTNYTLLCFQQ